MSAGARFEYHWQDGVNFKKPTKVSAPGTSSPLTLYSSELLLIQNGQVCRIRGLFDGLGTETIRRRRNLPFTTRYIGLFSLSSVDLGADRISRCCAGVPFPKNFNSTVKSIVRRLFRVYAHLYNHHFAILCALSIEGTLPLLVRLC